MLLHGYGRNSRNEANESSVKKDADLTKDEASQWTLKKPNFDSISLNNSHTDVTKNMIE